MKRKPVKTLMCEADRCPKRASHISKDGKFGMCDEHAVLHKNTFQLKKME